MKHLKFIALGLFFGVVLSKSEAISWFRIYEMFRFQSFHMYGIIGSAVAVGALLVFLAKKRGLRTVAGEEMKLNDKTRSVARYLIGGTIFGLGWALTGACPGPMFILFGHGVFAIGIVILGAVLGTFLYGLLRDKLPH